MKPEEVKPIVGQHGTTLCGRKGQDSIVGNGRISIPCRGEDIVAELPQFPRNLQRYVLVRVQVRHSSVFVIVNLSVDFGRVSARVVPRVHEILCPKRWVCGEKLLLGCSEHSRLFQQSNRDSRSDNACVAAQTPGSESIPGKVSPRSWTTHCRIWAFSPEESLPISSSNSRRVVMPYFHLTS